MDTFYSGGNFKSGNLGGATGAVVFGAHDEDKKRIAQGAEELKKDLLEKWNKENKNAQIFPTAFSRVHPEVIDFLLEFSRMADYDEIARQTNLSQQQRNELPHIVWQVAQTRNWNELASMLSQKITVAPAMSGAILQALDQKIIGKVRALAEKPFAARNMAEPVKKELSMPLREALEKMPRLAEQVLTANMLKLKYVAEPAKPSIRNWIVDYHDNMGSGKHEVMDRGNYLFHSENGKRLSASERQKVTTVLKSLDENMPVEIDGEKQMIVFNMPSSQSTTDNRQQATVAQEMPMRQPTALVQQTFVPRSAPQAANPFVARIQNEIEPENTSAQFAESTFPAERQIIKEEELSMDVQEKLKNFAPMQNAQSKNIFPEKTVSMPVGETEKIDTQKSSNYFGERIIAPKADQQFKSVLPDGYTREERDYGFKAPNYVPSAAPIVAKEEIPQRKDDASNLFDKGVGVGTEKYFANFSSAPAGNENKQISAQENIPAEGSVRFASPQQFSTERKIETKIPAQPAAVPAAHIEHLVAPKPQVAAPMQTQAPRHIAAADSLVKQDAAPASQPLPRPVRPLRSPYKITPMEDKFASGDSSIFNDSNPKVNGNIVDLKG